MVVSGEGEERGGKGTSGEKGEGKKGVGATDERGDEWESGKRKAHLDVLFPQATGAKHCETGLHHEHQRSRVEQVEHCPVDNVRC